MALPEQAIEHLARTPERTRGAYRQLLMLAITLFALSLFIYLGLVYGYKPYLEGQVSKLNAQINAFTQQIPIADQEALIHFYSQVANLKTILGTHVAPSAFFEWLQSNTQPNVYYIKLTVNIESHQLTLTGIAKTVEDAAEQLTIFQRDPNVQSVSFNNIGSAGGGLWQFVVNITLKPSLFTGGAIKNLPSSAPGTSSASSTPTSP